VFIPLGGCPRGLCLSHLTAVREASVYPA